MMIMKKNLLIAAIAITALASCSEEKYVGNNSPNNPEVSDAIAFGLDFQNVTRGGDLVGSSAAEKLQNQFVVYGTKHVSAEAADATNDMAVFQNYKVEYTANSAGTKASNTHNWDYVGLTLYASTIVSPVATSQTFKYWDYNAAQGYTFYAFASKADLEHKTNETADPLITVEKTTTGTTVYDKGYSIVVKTGADLSKLYLSDRTLVAKADYNKPVTLKFRNFGTHVRVGFYETIPGYSVKIDKFYVDDDASTTAESPTAPVTNFDNMIDGKTTFAAALQNINATAESNTLTVSYYNGSDGPANQVKVTPSTVGYNYSLVLGNGVINTTLSTSSATPTWDNTGGAYTTVYPCSSVANPMLIKVDYTLTAEDGGGEVIKVKGANVVVPTQYLQWNSNYAYTYIFKISDNTNGSTDGTVQGLYPITFDATVVDVADDKTQETITTFEDYSITTYANGSKVTTNDEYKAGEDIYVVKTDASTHAVVAPTAIGTADNNAQVYVATTSGDAISEATIFANLTGSPNGITLTATTSSEVASLVQNVPAADGTNFDFGANGAVKFTPSPAAAATYVYVFTRKAYVAPTYTAVGEAAYSNTETYYFKTTSNVYYAAAGISADNFATYKADLYTKTANGTPGVYDIKVIKVKP